MAELGLCSLVASEAQVLPSPTWPTSLTLVLTVCTWVSAGEQERSSQRWNPSGSPAEPSKHQPLRETSSSWEQVSRYEGSYCHRPSKMPSPLDQLVQLLPVAEMPPPNAPPLLLSPAPAHSLQWEKGKVSC